jgi:hypothetical protein
MVGQKLRVRTVDCVSDVCRRHNRGMPRHLVIQADNTVSWAKNKLVLLVLAVLVCRRKSRA